MDICVQQHGEFQYLYIMLVTEACVPFEMQVVPITSESNVPEQGSSARNGAHVPDCRGAEEKDMGKEQADVGEGTFEVHGEEEKKEPDPGHKGKGSIKVEQARAIEMAPIIDEEDVRREVDSDDEDRQRERRYPF